MADLIDREEATKLINEILIEISNGKIDLDEQILEQIAINITCIPPADTERHAHWIFKCGGQDRTGNYFVYVCSKCDKTIRVYQGYEMVEDYPYCRCGCKMDEVINDE